MQQLDVRAVFADTLLVTFQILSLSGGGYLGLYSLRLLESFEEDAGIPIARCFDLISGTSLGGIIALALAHEVPVAAVRKSFEEHGSAIFSARKAPHGVIGKIIDLARMLFSPKYKNRQLRKTLDAIFGDTRLADLKHRLIVPAVNLTRGAPQVFKTAHHSTFRRDHRLRCVDVALATSPAPTYFPVAEVGDELFADGGLFANAPDLIALHEAEHFLEIPASRIRMLSIGTTTTSFSFSHAAGVHLGVAQWVSGQRLVNAMMSSQQLLAQYMVQHRLPDRYLRIDEVQSTEQLALLRLDVAHRQAQQTLRGLAETSVRKHINNELLRAMLTHRAVAPEWQPFAAGG